MPPLNNKWKFQETEKPQESKSGFHAMYSNGEFEIVLNGTALPSADLAQQKAQMEMTNIQNLYKAHSNPYVGQVSDLVQCAQDLKPKTSEISSENFAGGKTQFLVGGATERKMFGACTKDQVAYWAGYFNFFYEPQKMAVEVRLYMKNKGSMASAHLKLKALGEELFGRTGNPL